MRFETMNIEFEYRYRDYGNFKNYNSIVFGNKHGLPVKEIEQKISRMLGNELFFDASRIGIPEMFFKQFPYDPELDWPMHEYCGVSETMSPINAAEGRDIRDLLDCMEPVKY
jgi:hypothetical protein